MHLPYTLIAGAAVLWSAARLVTPPLPVGGEDIPALGIPGSAYGSLVARTMREPLYAYWHGGELAGIAKRQAAPAVTAAEAPPPPPAGGIFSRRRLASQAQDGTDNSQPPPAPVPALATNGDAASPPVQESLLDRGTSTLLKLESRRTKRQGQFTASAAHLRYINASADWRLRLACQLDPGDAALYEILHSQIIARAKSEAEARTGVRELARKAIARALSPDGGMGDALTGAGASLNLLNDALQTSRTGGSAQTAIATSWDTLELCLQRYRKARSEAGREGWWDNISYIRQQEIEDHARFLEGLRVKFRDHLAAKGLIIASSDGGQK